MKHNARGYDEWGADKVELTSGILATLFFKKTNSGRITKCHRTFVTDKTPFIGVVVLSTYLIF